MVDAIFSKNREQRLSDFHPVRKLNPGGKPRIQGYFPSPIKGLKTNSLLYTDIL